MSETNEAVESVEVSEQDVVESQDHLEIVEGEGSSEQYAESAESVEVAAETADELKEEISEAIDDGATEEEVKSMIEKFQLKVNGKIVEKELDLSDHEAVKRELQKAAAFSQTAQEASDLKKMYESEIQRLQQNPWEVLKELGLNPEELNERFLEDRITEMKKTPDQVVREQMEKELSDARKQLAEIETERQSESERKSIQEAESILSDEIEQALDAHKTLPPTQKTVSRIADALIYAMNFADENGYDSSQISVADVIPHVEEEYRMEMRNLLDNAPEQMLEEYVGKQNIERLRKNRVAAVKNNPKQVVTKTAASTNVSTKPKEKVSMSDYFRNLERAK